MDIISKTVKMPKAVCFIIPPSIFLLDQKTFPSLGILKLAAVAEQAGILVEVLDLNGISNFTDAVRDHVSISAAKIFGITATTPQLPATIEIVKTIRAVRPDANIILGGPHITLVSAAYKREKKLSVDGRAVRAMRVLEDAFDVLVAGDGEDAIFLACVPDAPKLIDADDPKSPLFLNDERLTNLPFPARHLIALPDYHYTIKNDEGENVPATSLIAQLGCPFNCGFCGGRESAMLRRIRMRTSENIVAEMEHLHHNYGFNAFMMYDDELNVNKRMIELMRQITVKQRELGVQWWLRGFIKSQLFTDEQAEAMQKAGFREILVGFESGSPRILENINKKATLEENTRCVEIARRHRLQVKALMSLGHPGETKETIRDTGDWLMKVKPDNFDATIITCYPGTPYYDYAVPRSKEPGIWTYTFKKTGDCLHQVEIDYTTTADYYKGDPDGGYVSYVFTDSLSCDELVEERDKLERNVREALGISYNTSAAAQRYEHSMGQFGRLPDNILRATGTAIKKSLA